MSALRSLWDEPDEVARPTGRAKTERGQAGSAPFSEPIEPTAGTMADARHDAVTPRSVSALPLLPQPVASSRWRHGRYLGINQLDGPDYDDAVDAADAAAAARDAMLHPVAETTRTGWQKEDVA